MKKNLLIQKSTGAIQRIIFLTSAFCLLSSYCAYAQAWTWMKGCNVAGCNGTWGTQGIPALTNTPEGIYAPYYWIDAQKNLWIYGGPGVSSSICI